MASARGVGQEVMSHRRLDPEQRFFTLILKLHILLGDAMLTSRIMTVMPVYITWAKWVGVALKSVR